MGRVKWGLSLIFAVMLAGIVSTTAFAAEPYGLTSVQNGLGLNVSFTGNQEAVGTNFLLELKDNNGEVLHTYGPVATSGDAPGKGTFSIPSTDLTVGTIYTVALYLSDTGNLTSPTGDYLSKTSVMVTDSHNKSLPKLPDPAVDIDGSGLTNANLTGKNNVNKSKSGQNIHGFYQNNTNSCASCHQTHTGSDDNLLFKDGIYSTCSACHDGTTGAYNYFSPVTEKTVDSVEGTFNVMEDGHNGSLHVSDGTLKVSSAPGGNMGASDSNEQWGQEFDCASCHAAHGSGSSAENNLNLDPLGWATVTYSTLTKDGGNGKLFKNIPIYNKSEIPAEMDTPYILVKTTIIENDISSDKSVNNYFFKRIAESDSNFTVGTKVIMTYRWDDTKYVPDYSLWLQDKAYPYKADTALYKDAWSNLSLTEENHYNDASNDITRAANVHVVWRDGFAWGEGVAEVQSAQVSLGIDIETTTNIRSLYDSSFSAYIPDSGTEMSKFCTACHTDYLTSTRTVESGLYTLAHRHKTTDNLTCIRCHFAHGSEAKIMKDANDNTYFSLTAAGGVFDATVSDSSEAEANKEKALNYLTDKNSSSALKRFTCMSVCYACHGKGEQFMGNQINSKPDKTVNQTLYGGEPGTPRTGN